VPDPTKRVTLGDVARALEGELTGDLSERVVDVTHDSRRVAAESLFVAIQGANVDANQFIAQAIDAGAVGIVSERLRPEGFAGNWIKVTDARSALAKAAAEVHYHPSRELKLVGITGTNGKTTTAYVVASIAEAASGMTALLSTVEYRLGSERVVAQHTTPEASDVQRHLRRAVDAGCAVAVMESSSQAIDLHRCDALHYTVAVFTNLTRDHLDYHGTMENYFASKRRLFEGIDGDPPEVSIINLDDEYGARLAEDLTERHQRVVSYALESSADVSAKEIEYSLAGMKLRLVTPQGERRVATPLVGRPHVYNIVAAAASCLAVGIPLDVIVSSFESCSGAPGRFERVPHTGDFAVVVDYAHTDDALLNVLRTAREVSRGRVITVFGCGGERDKTKRAPMGEIAARLSDVAIATSDNPRREDPEAILDDVEVGMRTTDRPYMRITDRLTAIKHAVADARTGDVVVIAGKGHEDYQILGTEKVHFDDKEVAALALKERGLVP
jgi:UDP-N-acetylmuramyl-tripeptide synthetase